MSDCPRSVFSPLWLHVPIFCITYTYTQASKHTHSVPSKLHFNLSQFRECTGDWTERWIMMIRHRGWGQLTRDRVGYKSAAECCGTPRAVLQVYSRDARCDFMSLQDGRLDPMILTAANPQMLDWFSRLGICGWGVRSDDGAPIVKEYHGSHSTHDILTVICWDNDIKFQFLLVN